MNNYIDDDNITLEQLYKGELVINYRVPKMQLYNFVYKLIYKFIKSGQLKKGDKLPSEKELGTFFGVGRTTIRMALVLLQEDRLVETVHGKGTFVVYDKDILVNKNSHLNETIKQYIENRGFEYKCLKSDLLVCPYDDFLADKLNASKSDKIYRLNSIHSANNEVFAVTNDFFVASKLFPNNIISEDIISNEIEELYSIRIKKMLLSFSPSVARMDRRKQLNLKSDTNILLVTAEGYMNEEVVIYSKRYINTLVLEYKVEN